MFTRVSKETVIQCYRANELLSYEIFPKQKKTKKIQKDVLQKTASISPAVHDIASVYTNPIVPLENKTVPDHNKKKKKVMFNICECYDSEADQDHKPETWDSITNFYGNADTTEVWANSENHKSKFQQAHYKRKHSVVETNGKLKDNTNHNKKQKRRSKTHKKRGNHFKTQIISNDIKRTIYPISENPSPPNTSIISLFRKKNAQLAEDKSKYEKRSTSKTANPEDFTLLRKKCPDDVCAEEATTNKSCKCKCKCNIKTHFITKELSRNLLSINSMVKIKDKILCTCHKYSQKVINMKPNNKDVVNNDQISKKNNLTKQPKKINDIIIKKEHECEQTGEPFFEIQVNPQDMCVLNPTEIKENVIKYGRPEKNEPKCICPSRGTLRSGEVCKAGVCKKAYKNKQVNFNCWCQKKIAECGDTTCDITNIEKPQKNQNNGYIRNQRFNKPLLEVQLDMDKMCVVNPKEIEEKIINNISVDDICSSGVCREAALIQKAPYVCKCIRKKIYSDITECTEDTCMDTTAKKKSKFSLLCTRICSKSDNWSSRKRNNQRKSKRRSFYEIGSNKLRNGKITTETEHLRKDKVEKRHDSEPKINIAQNSDTNKLKINQERKSKLNVTQKNVADKLKTRQENMPDLNITQNYINKSSQKNNLNRHNFITSPPRLGELKLYNPTNIKHPEISKDFTYKTNDVICACAHRCECGIDRVDDIKHKLNNRRHKERLQKNKLRRKMRNKRKYDRDFQKDQKQRAKLDKKGERKAAKERMREIKMMQKKMKEEPLDTNVCTAFLLGILKIGLRTLIFIFTLIFTVIRKPKKAYWYVRDRIRDPEGTCNKLRKWFRDAIMIKKLEITETVRGSDTLTILADHFLDTPFYQTFANKGRTKKDQMEFEEKSKARKRRIRKREQQAIHSCRHMLLTTLRHTPCLWVYHICPNFYPQCLSLLSFMRSFSRIILFLIAFACWTPCIISFELCRAFLCCFMCTG